MTKSCQSEHKILENKNNGDSSIIPLAEYIVRENGINYKLASMSFPGLLLSISNYHSQWKSQLGSLVVLLKVIHAVSTMPATSLVY